MLPFAGILLLNGFTHSHYALILHIFRAPRSFALSEPPDAVSSVFFAPIRTTISEECAYTFAPNLPSRLPPLMALSVSTLLFNQITWRNSGTLIYLTSPMSAHGVVHRTITKLGGIARQWLREGISSQQWFGSVKAVHSILFRIGHLLCYRWRHKEHIFLSSVDERNKCSRVTRCNFNLFITTYHSSKGNVIK